MQETQKMFEPVPGATPAQGEETLVTPRFDEEEAQVARPVVPLADNFAPPGVAGVRPRRRRQWPIALVLISALAGGVVSLLAFRLYQQRQQQSQVAATQTDTGAQEQDATQTNETAPPLAQTAATETSSDAPVVFEEFDPAKEGVASAGVGSAEAKPARPAETDVKPAATGKEERKEEAKPAPRAAESKPRLVETISGTPRQVEARGENVSRDERRNNDDDFFEERRERRRERREQRREQRRGRGRNIDRIKDIFEGPPA